MLLALISRIQNGKQHLTSHRAFPLLFVVTRKYSRGIAALERRTGVLSLSSNGNTLTQRAAGADPLTDDGNIRWYGTISVGSPAVEYKGEPYVHITAQYLIHNHLVDFDTGSADLFLPGSSCDSTCDGHTLYNPNASSSAVGLQQNFSLSYGDGSTVSGELYTDTVSIAGFVVRDLENMAHLRYLTIP